MYNLTQEDKKILSDYRKVMEDMIQSTDNQDVHKSLGASVDRLSGEMDNEKLRAYIEAVFSSKKETQQEMNYEAMEIMKKVKTAAVDLGFMALVKRFREGS